MARPFGDISTGFVSSYPPPSNPVPSPAEVRDAVSRIADNIELVIEGKRAAIKLGLTVLLAEGHLLIEDVPGVGKIECALQ